MTAAQALCYNFGAVARRQEPSLWLKQAGLLTAIPFVLLVGPTLGYYLGTVLDRHWRYAPWGVGIGVIFGFASSGKAIADLIRQSKDLDSKQHER